MQQSGLTYTAVRGSRMQQSGAHICSSQGLTYAAVRGSRMQQSGAHVCSSQGLTYSVVRGSRMQQSGAHVYSSQELTYTVVRGGYRILKGPKDRITPPYKVNHIHFFCTVLPRCLIAISKQELWRIGWAIKVAS